MTTLSGFEITKYHRQIILPGIGTVGQEKIKEARVLVIGAGGLGCPVLMYLTAAGVGQIGIADYDKVDISNIHRQVLYTADDTGKFKTAVAAARLREMNPDCHITTYNVRITKGNIMDIISGYDLVIDGSDNFATRYLLSDATEMLGIPMVFGAVYQFYGQASVFNYNNGPSYRCLFPEPPEHDEVPSCSPAGVIGMMPGIVGSIQAGEAIKIITGIGEPLSGRLLQIDILDFRTEIIRFSCSKDYKPVETLGDYDEACGINVKSISPEELQKKLSAGTEINIYDIRPASEYDKFNISGVNILSAELLNDPKMLPASGMIVIVCETGDESFAVADYLQNNENIANVFNLDGGIRNWLNTTEKQ